MDPQVAAIAPSKYGPLPHPVQGAGCGEVYSLRMALRSLEVGVVEIASDCQLVVDVWAKGPDQDLGGLAYSEVWVQIFQVAQDDGIESITLLKVAAAFVEAVGGVDFPASCRGRREALANEVIRRAVRFVEGPLMPLSVKCHPAMPPRRPSGDSLDDQLPEAERARPDEEWESRQQTLRDLKEAARRIDAALVGGAGHPRTSAMCEGVCFGHSDHGELAGCELRAALILCLDLSMWTSALCPEDAPKAEPPAPPKFTMPSLMLTEIVDMQSGAVGSTPGAQAWEVLKPLLALDGLPASLRHQVATLRAQSADMLTRDRSEAISQRWARIISQAVDEAGLDASSSGVRRRPWRGSSARSASGWARCNRRELGALEAWPPKQQRAFGCFRPFGLAGFGTDPRGPGGPVAV
ncbi:unnamed protein product [Prorocentrum cordatum]|uniref:RNase H type-1 domain-containing protein n=1 Tax=Prorocentrum cordatum TaxID=2364126 RepID=A0ABN9WNP4_9DINO|nr:unnamed protein product [Polarella glacialis]